LFEALSKDGAEMKPLIRFSNIKVLCVLSVVIILI